MSKIVPASEIPDDCFALYWPTKGFPTVVLPLGADSESEFTSIRMRDEIAEVPNYEVFRFNQIENFSLLNLSRTVGYA